MQRDIVFSLRKERVAQLIGEMTPGQAADIVAVLPAAEKRAILGLLEPAQGREDRRDHGEAGNQHSELHHEQVHQMSAGNDRRSKPAAKFREMARSMDVVMYFYIVNETDKLLGVIDIKELFMAEDDVLLRDLMVENVISLNPESTMKQAADAFHPLWFPGASRHR